MKSDPTSRKTFLDAASLEAIDRVIETVHRLRAPGGCPWDQKQTHQSLRPYLVEESYEVLEVLDQIDSTEKLRDPKIRDALKEEFGDLLMQIALHTEMTREAGAFSFADVARTLDTPANTMSTQLAILARAGLIGSRRERRSIVYSANYDAIAGLIGFLMEDCCQGRPEICAPIAAKAACCVAPSTCAG